MWANCKAWCVWNHSNYSLIQIRLNGNFGSESDVAIYNGVIPKSKGLSPDFASHIHCTKKWNFSLGISSVNVTKSAGNLLIFYRYFVKKVFLEFFAKFTGKHPCQSLFFNKVAGPTKHQYATVSEIFITCLPHKIC